jgi:hypothetical protein
MMKVFKTCLMWMLCSCKQSTSLLNGSCSIGNVELVFAVDSVIPLSVCWNIISALFYDKFCALFNISSRQGIIQLRGWNAGSEACTHILIGKSFCHHIT